MSAEDAFKRLEELASVQAKKKLVLTPEQKALKAEAERVRMLDPEKRARKAEAERVRMLDPEKRARKAETNRARRLDPEKMARELEVSHKWRAKNPEKMREHRRKWRADNPEKAREIFLRQSEKRAGDPELFAINQAEKYACAGNVTRDITANCPEPARGRLQALVDQIRRDPSAGKQVIALLRNMRDLRKLELAEMAQATETETEN